MNAPARASTTFLPVTPALRQLIENVVEDLMLILDELDGNPDEEPSLGWTGREAAYGCNLGTDDREFDVADAPHDPEEDSGGADTSDAPTVARYAIRLEGACMEPLLPDGCRIAVDGLSAVKPGDIVLIHRDPRFVPPGEYKLLAKRLVADHRSQSGPREGLLVEMLNPPKQIFVPAAHIVAVHRVEGVYQDIPSGMIPTTDVLTTPERKRIVGPTRVPEVVFAPVRAMPLAPAERA
jgi:hypothetical protein